MFRFLSIFSFFLLFASCAERSDVRESESQKERDSDSLAHPTNKIDSAYINQLTTEQLDSLEFRLTHHYTLNDNFIVKADSIKLVPRDDETTDTCYVKKDEMLVVVKIKRNRVSQDDDSVELSSADANLMKSMEEADKEIDAPESKLTENRQVGQPTDSVPADTVWIKVAGNQYKMGWITERSLLKYHSGGLWANSCCSHPRVGEEIVEAAYRRVPEELGCKAVELRELCAFVYRAEFDNGIIEHEFDHVVIGRCEGEIVPDPAEASEVRWVGFDALAAELADAPRSFAAWAPIVFTMTMADLLRRDA